MYMQYVHLSDRRAKGQHQTVRQRFCRDDENETGKSFKSSAYRVRKGHIAATCDFRQN